MNKLNNEYCACGEKATVTGLCESCQGQQDCSDSPVYLHLSGSTPEKIAEHCKCPECRKAREMKAEIRSWLWELFPYNTNEMTGPCLAMAKHLGSADLVIEAIQDSRSGDVTELHARLAVIGNSL